MTTTFATTLANIRSDASIFGSLDERAVEIGVVLPLLRELGWNTDNVREIYPQRGLTDGTKVDYDLQINGESRILIEVKRWGHTLNDEDDIQLARYCRLAKPKLAVLTSGLSWRICLPPNQRKNDPLKRFEEIDITSMQPEKIERDFRQFLARNSMVHYKPTVAAAKKLYRELESYRKFKTTLTDTWNELASDNVALAKLVTEFMENKGIPTSQENILRFLDSHQQPLVHAISSTVSLRKKPASFALPTSPTGRRKKTYNLIGIRNSWNNLLMVICQEMRKRHPDSFQHTVLSMTTRFAESRDSKFSTPVGDAGIYAKRGNSREIRDNCYDLVEKFQYPSQSLEIRDSKGAIL